MLQSPMQQLDVRVLGVREGELVLLGGKCQ